jgi:hypothetical protein
MPPSPVESVRVRQAGVGHTGTTPIHCGVVAKLRFSLEVTAMPKSRKPTKAPPTPSRHPKPGTTPPEDSDLVITPGGWRPRSQVHGLKPGHHISGKGGRLRIIETSTGKVINDLGEISKNNRFERSTSGKKRRNITEHP